MTLTLTSLHVPGAVATAVGQTPPLLVIHRGAGLAPPALPADAGAGDTEAVTTAVRVHAVH